MANYTFKIADIQSLTDAGFPLRKRTGATYQNPAILSRGLPTEHGDTFLLDDRQELA